MIKAQSAPALVPISYGLRAMGPADLAVVRGWLTEPHVMRWWAHPQADHPASERTRHCVLHPHHGRPRHGRFAGVRPPSCTAFRLRTSKRLATLPRPAARRARHRPFLWRGKVHRTRPGSCLIRRTLEHPFEEDIPCMVTDPDPANARSVAAFCRAGLRCTGERDTAWGHALLMRRDNLKPTISP